MKTRIHAIAGAIGLLTILTFWTSTILSELFGSHETVAAVKGWILYGMFILVPAMAIAGASGAMLASGRTDPLVLRKKKRMPFIAANGLLVLVPLAFFLASKAAAGAFDTSFYLLQGVELVAGATNITLMGLNMRDGIRLAGRTGKAGGAALLGREEVARDTIAVRIAKPAGFSHEPGQAIRVTIPTGIDAKAGGASRVLSIASAPGDDALTVVTRVRDSAFKQALKTMPIGAELQVAGPLGAFTIADPKRHAVFLAGGIGITPFLSMIRHAQDAGSPAEITLFYSNRTPQDAAMLDELQTLAAANPKFRLVALMSDPADGEVWDGETGRMDAAVLSRHVSDLNGPAYYCVGPAAFVKTMGGMLGAAGVDGRDIRTEQFTGY